MKTEIIFILILFYLPYMGQCFFADTPFFSYDHIVADIDRDDYFYNCYNGKRLIEVDEAEITFPEGLRGAVKVTISTFQIQEQAVSLKDYLRYLRLSSRELPDVLKGLNGGEPDADMLGLTFGEANDYCRFFGQTLPTEAEFELAFFHSDNLRQEHNELYEWTQDFFRAKLPFQLRSRDPVVKTPGYQKTVRDKKLGQRKGQALQFRSATTTFRCVTHLQPMHKKEILLDHSQIRPNASDTVAHFYSIHTKPAQAVVYRDPTFHHRVGQTPFFGLFEGNGVTFTIIKEGYMPEVLYLNTPPNRGQQLSLELRPVPVEQYTHRSRDARMQLVSGGRVRVGLSEREFVQIKNEVVSLRNNRDLTDEQIRRYILDEGPDRIVYARDFYMDENEVTNGQYENYMQASGANRPRCDYSDPDLPVSCINWLEAYQFCAFYGLNLPTELQFDKAAMGAKERLRAVWLPKKKQAVGSDKNDLSRYGIKDLAGNVSEWSRDWYDPELYQRFMMTAPRATSIHKELKSVRGPSFASHRLDNRLQKRRAMNPQAFANDVGFRCVQEL